MGASNGNRTTLLLLFASITTGEPFAALPTLAILRPKHSELQGRYDLAPSHRSKLILVLAGVFVTSSRTCCARPGEHFRRSQLATRKIFGENSLPDAYGYIAGGGLAGLVLLASRKNNTVLVSGAGFSGDGVADRVGELCFLVFCACVQMVFVLMYRHAFGSLLRIHRWDRVRLGPCYSVPTQLKEPYPCLASWQGEQPPIIRYSPKRKLILI